MKMDFPTYKTTVEKDKDLVVPYLMIIVSAVVCMQ